MVNDRYIPVGIVRKDLAEIDARLSELKREHARLREEEARLSTKRDILAELEQKAVLPTVGSRPRVLRKEGFDAANPKRPADVQAEAEDGIPNGRVATPIILQMIRERPGIKSIEVIDALHCRVTKKSPKGPRKFLGDLLWELGHRKKLRRHPDGGLYLVEQGGGS
jgi:hypothetical protein